jgi:hypothetical protein
MSRLRSRREGGGFFNGDNAARRLESGPMQKTPNVLIVAPTPQANARTEIVKSHKFALEASGAFAGRRPSYFK